MNILSELKKRFAAALAGLVDDPAPLLAMIRPTQDAKLGDYQANCAMPLGKQLGLPPRQVAQQIVDRLDVAGMCEPPEIAGPGFINLRLKEAWLADRLAASRTDDRLGVVPAERPRTFVLDFSSPNVAKPMHVGHIRSTVIGDSLCRLLRFLGHKVISDNHLGDWGTQFGMIIYGFKHFVDPDAYRRHPVEELSRLYRLVRRLIDYREALEGLPELDEEIARQQEQFEKQKAAPAPADAADKKKEAKLQQRSQLRLNELRKQRDDLAAKIEATRTDSILSLLLERHADIARAVLEETAKLHAGDEENLRLWHEFLPHCRADIQRIYDRLDVRFDVEYGESFYQDRLAGVVESFERAGLARESEGAVCLFLDGFETPMIIRKKDGAFLYATTDLATIGYRMETWQPDAILYVVDFRQGEHFEKLFAAARLWGYDRVELQHISFGTVLGDDGRPFKTRSGDTVGLEGLLDEAVARALAIVSENDDAKPDGPELSPPERQKIARSVGIAALKYADLTQNRTSDYVFSYDKMLAMNGNTATYMQYSYARVRSIFAKGEVDAETLRALSRSISLDHPAERALAMALLRLPEALAEAETEYRPNCITAYLYELSKCYSTFFENCSVLKAETPELRESRLLLCDFTARVLKCGLELLGIHVVERM